jgi:ankyrin repeat protein
MLLKFIFFLVCLLITVSCASSTHDNEEIASRFSQDGEALIKEALDTPEISSQFTSSSHAILSSIAIKNEYALSFYDFAVQRYDFNYFGFDSEDPQSWNAFVNCPFRDFSSQQPDQAQEIINQIVLPSHPFLYQVPFKLHTADFLNQMILDIDTYLDKVAKDIFIQQFSQILALEDPSEAQILLKALLHKAKNSSFPDPEFKYHRAFLANVPFDYFKRTYYCHPEHHNSINSFISQLAPILYNEIAEDSKQLADKILSGLLPSIYSTLTDTSYENSIGKYQESALQPIDKSYLWDQQEFQVDLLEALQALTIVENPNFPPYLIIIKWLSNVSSLNHLFNHYIVQNFCKPSYLSPRDQPLFWRSLIFSSFTDFSAIFSDHSSQIIEKLQLLPSLDEEKLLFVYGLLDDQFTSKNHFYLLSDWGHKSTIELLLQRRTDISADHVGSALEHAARSGYSSIVELLLQRHTDIHEFHVGCALYNASEGGHASTVDLLLQRCTIISAENFGGALKKAAESGYTHIVELLLQSDAEIAADHIGWALQNATKSGYTSVVNRLLQYCNHIPADHVGLALRNVAKSGHTHIVELLLQYCNHIHADHVGWALRYAAEGGHTLIVEQLLRRNTELPADYIGFALNGAARGGHTSIVELFLQRRTDISADDVGCALFRAVLDCHTSTVEFLLQRCSDIPAEDVVVAFRNSAYYVKTPIVDLLLQHRTDIPDFCVVEAFLEAADSGETVIVELILQRRADSVSNCIGQALHKAAQGGHTSTFELLRRHLAGEILFRLLPSIYSNLIDTSYENAIKKYQESLIQPINKSYCWDPKLFDDLLRKGLRALSFIENHNSPPYLKVLEFISKYSSLARLFRDYIAQNFHKPFYLRNQHVTVFFWRSLIFSSFIVFSSLFPDHSRQILKHLQLLPSLDEVRPLFLHGLLDDQLSYKDKFLLVSGWGHTLTVDLLLQFHTDISPDDVGKALRDAASGGHTSTVELLLKRRTDLSSDYVGWALRDAAFFGHILIVDLLLQSRTDISADYSGEALKNAAQNGNSSIVELIIQRCTYIHVYYFGLALSGASGNGHTLIVQDLFHSRSNINPTEFSCALVSAAENGHTSTVEFLLKNRTDIPAGFVGWALCNAAKGGYSLIVKLLLQYRNDIDVNHVRSALKDAARDGHTSIVDLLRRYQLKNDL